MASALGVAATKRSNRAVYSTTAASPRARTSARISPTVSWIAVATCSGERSSAATTAPAPSVRASSVRIIVRRSATSPHTARRAHLQRSAGARLARHPDHEPAKPDSESERRVHVGRLFEQDVLADDPVVGGSVTHVGGDVGGVEEQQSQTAARVREDQLA